MFLSVNFTALLLLLPTKNYYYTQNYGGRVNTKVRKKNKINSMLLDSVSIEFRHVPERPIGVD